MMPKKRKTNVRRHPSGKIVREPAIDRGTPEIQARRQAWLGARAHTMERLSAENPIDVLAAHGWLDPPKDYPDAPSASELVDAARAYQHHYAVMFGPLAARAQVIGLVSGPGISTRRRILIQRELALWDRMIADQGAWASQVFRLYVVDQAVDDTVRAVVRAGTTRDIDGAYRMRVVTLRGVLEKLAEAPPVRVHQDEVDAAEHDERRGA